MVSAPRPPFALHAFAKRAPAREASSPPECVADQRYMGSPTAIRQKYEVIRGARTRRPRWGVQENGVTVATVTRAHIVSFPVDPVDYTWRPPPSPN